jgi:hypothetical protein
MAKNQNPERTRRLVFVISGVTDTVIGAVIVMMALGLLPVDVGEYGLPTWAPLAIGGIMLVSGMAIAIYHLTRLGE